VLQRTWGTGAMGMRRCDWAGLLLVVGLPGCGAGSYEARLAAILERNQMPVERDERLPGNPVVAVDFRVAGVGGPIENGTLTKLAVFKQLRSLDLTMSVSDVQLRELAPFLHLESLSLSDTQVTDAGLKQLAALDLPQLHSLNLHYTRVTDA